MAEQTETTTTQAQAPQAQAPAPEGGADGGGRGMVPYARLSEVIAERNLWKTQAEEARGKAGEAQTLAARVAELEAQHARAAESWAEERAFLGTGLTDPEAQDAARWAWGRVPADQRPEGGMSAWLAGVKADPSKAPKALQPYLAPAQAEPAAPSPQPGPPRQPAATGRAPAATGAVSAAALKTAREAAQRSGDWTAHDALVRAYEQSRRS